MSEQGLDPKWGTQTLVRAFVPESRVYWRTYRPHGLAHQSTWVWACVCDEQGQQYAITREFKVEASTLAVISKLERGVERDSPRLYANLYLGIVEHDIDPASGRVSVRSYPSKGALGFSVEIEPQRYRHSEAGGEVELEYRALGPALEYYCPGELEDGLYASELCSVEGTVRGARVRGFGGMDIAWGPPGIGWTQGKIYRLLEEYWVVFANEFADGGLEYGVAVDGAADFSVGFLVRDGYVVHAGRAEIQMERDAGGFPRQARIALGADRYEFRTAARVAQIKGLMQWASGEMARAGQPRAVRRRFAWIEYFARGRSGGSS